MVPPCRATRFLLLLVALAPLQLAAQTSASTSESDEGWNAPAALALVARAREVRQRSAGDPELRSYQASATGHVFFLFDRPGTERRTLVKADQVALEVFWRAPRDTRQRIIGMRDEKVLPTNIRYHLDHLTVVQDDFGDQIRLGDGDEVSAVAHPAAPGSEAVYEFRLGDSLSIAYGGASEVLVYEIQVRPRDADLPGFVGSMFVDRANAAIVRMTFTFTPASYVDSYLDYIRISLDNSLWEGKWWLPYRQEVEIRRELPQLDFLAGSVIRGRFEIGEYAFNPDLPDALFMGPRVTAVAQAEREAYPFETPLVPPEESEELDPTPTLSEIREQALQLTAGRYLSGLSRFRVHVPSASELFRWNRAEGAFVGAGAAWQPSGGASLKAHAGWSFGRVEPALTLALEDGEGRKGVRAAWNELRDLGPLPGAQGVLNTISALTANEDWTDPWFSSGVAAYVGAPGARITLLAERHEPATWAVDAAEAADFRPLPAVQEGWLAAIEGSRASSLAAGLDLGVTARVATFDPVAAGDQGLFGSLVAALSWDRTAAGGLGTVARLDGGAIVGDFPEQSRFFLGGRGTLPGHPYRAQAGDVFGLARIEASRPLVAPWVTLRALGAAGFTGEMAQAATGATPPVSRAAFRASAGAGVGLAWDVIHLDMMRGLDGGEWELVVSVDRRFLGWL